MKSTEDPSVDVDTLTRSAVLAQLNLKNSESNVSQLRIRLRKHLEKNHPIHDFLSGLENADIKKIYNKIAANPNIKMISRMKKFIADEFLVPYFNLGHWF